MRKAIIVFVLSGLLVSCGMGELKEMSEQTVNNFYLSIINSDFKSSLNYLSDDFFKSTSKSEMLRFLENVKLRQGEMKSFTQLSWKVSSSLSPDGPKTICTLTYKVTYTHYKAVETLITVKTGRGETKIESYTINSDSLQKNQTVYLNPARGFPL